MINRTQDEIMAKWPKANFENPLVSIECLTYNHEKYIAQTLDGFLCQDTTFPFEVIIHDDASTDNTASIIKQYELKFPKIVKPIYETENQWSKHDGSLGRIIREKITGKYIAICEGDDYWTYPDKLQMQIAYMEKHPDCGMTYSKVVNYFQNTNTFGSVVGKKSDSVIKLISNGNTIPTQSECYRRDFYYEYLKEIDPSSKKWKMGDYPFNLWMAHNHKIHFFNKTVGVYRVLEESASHSKDIDFLLAFAKSTNEIITFFKDKYNIKCKTPNHETIILFNNALSNNDRENVIKYAKYDELFKCNFMVHLKVFIFKHDLLFAMYKKYKKL